MITAYLYNEETKEFQSSQMFEKDNLIPENSTTKKVPMVGIDEVAIFDNETSKWKVVKDYRFTHKMIKDNEIFNIENYGEIPDGYKLVTNEEADQLQEYKRTQMLSMTKLDFFKYVVSPNGITYNELKQIIGSDENLSAQWELCSRVYRYNSLLDIDYISKFIPDVTSDMLDEIFKTYGTPYEVSKPEEDLTIKEKSSGI